MLFIFAWLLLLSRVPVQRRPDETLRMDICPTLIENRHLSKPRPPGAENAGAITDETHRSHKTVLRICLLSSVSKGYRLDKARATEQKKEASAAQCRFLQHFTAAPIVCCPDPSSFREASCSLTLPMELLPNQRFSLQPCEDKQITEKH